MVTIRRAFVASERRLLRLSDCQVCKAAVIAVVGNIETKAGSPRKELYDFLEIAGVIRLDSFFAERPWVG